MKDGKKSKITYTARTDRGFCRSVNQDAAAAFAEGDLGLFAVSDGMGGHSRGELASAWIVKGFEAYWEQLKELGRTGDFKTLVSSVQQELCRMNEQILARFNRGQICGATVVVLLIAGNCYAVFSAGDSRIYTCAGGKCSVLTVDDIWDTLPSTLNEYTKEQIRVHENQGKLVQAVGVRPLLNIHVRTDKLRHGQIFCCAVMGCLNFAMRSG